MPTSAAATIPASQSIKSNNPWCPTFPHLRRTPISCQPKPYQVPAKNIWNLPGPLLLSYSKLSSSLKPYLVSLLLALSLKPFSTQKPEWFFSEKEEPSLPCSRPSSSLHSYSISLSRKIIELRVWAPALLLTVNLGQVLRLPPPRP